MKHNGFIGERRFCPSSAHKKDRLITCLPYVGIPIVGAALLFLQIGKINAFSLFLYELVIVFGYVAAILDIKTKRIPNILVIAMLAAWVLVITPRLFFDTDAAVAQTMTSLLGFAMGGGMFLFVYLISRGGLGGGDVKFMAGVGLYLGFNGTITTMLFGTVLAALTGLILIMMKKISRKDKIPLAPFLYIGILITVFLQ